MLDKPNWSWMVHNESDSGAIKTQQQTEHQQ
jgi:hypothetical protein